jgi:hypothetical protein
MPATYANLKIFRGTFAQVSALTDIENMTFYLATDTNQLFVGNNEGQLEEFSGDAQTTREEVQELITRIADVELPAASLGASIINLGDREVALNSRVTTTENRITTLESTLTTAINDRFNELAADGELFEDYSTDQDVADAVNELKAFVNTELANYYTSNQVETAINLRISGQNAILATKEYVNNAVSDSELYNSVKLLNEGNVVDSDGLAAFMLASSTDNGLYAAKVSIGNINNYHYELVTKNNADITRVLPDGVIQKLTAPSTWVEVIGSSITKVNNISKNALGEITINADNIEDTASRKWHSLIPNVNGVVNIGGRDQNPSKSVGNNSIAIGLDSSAGSLSSVSVGYKANVTANANNAIQLGEGSNESPNTFQLWENKIFERFPVNVQNNEWETKLRPEVVTETFATITVSIPVVAWTVENTVVINVNNLKASSLVWVSPNEETYTTFVDYEVRAIAQGNGTITFKCLDTPDAVVKVNLIVKAMEYDN